MNSHPCLVVSVHDVAPPSWQPVKEILAQLNALGVPRVSLLVIPNYRGQWRVDEHGEFAGWLRERADGGDEIVLHGYEHVEVKPPHGLRDRLKNRLYTVGEGEFLSLTYEEAKNRMEQGLAVFKKAGIQSAGFVAPSWLLSAQGVAAARDLGFQYTNYYLKFTDLGHRKEAFAPSLVFGPGQLNEDWALRSQRFLASLLNRCSLVRVVIHPPCVENIRRFAQTLGIIREQLVRHRPVTYAGYLSDWRNREAAASRAGKNGGR
jgi:predicted deacetylase